MEEMESSVCTIAVTPLIFMRCFSKFCTDFVKKASLVALKYRFEKDKSHVI